MAVTLETELQSLIFWLLPKSAALIVQISLPSALICTICPSQILDIVIGTSDEKASSNQHDYSLFNITPQSD